MRTLLVLAVMALASGCTAMQPKQTPHPGLDPWVAPDLSRIIFERIGSAPVTVEPSDQEEVSDANDIRLVDRDD